MIDALRPALAAEPGSGLLPVFLAVAVLLAAAKLLGEFSIQFGQPAVLGELLAGLILGPSLLNVLSFPVFAGHNIGETVHILGQIGVLFLMFAAGLEVGLAEMRASGTPAVLGGVLGVVSPILMGWGTAALFGYPTGESIFIGIALSATSVSISAQTLLELGRLRTKEGFALLGAAVIDDILVIVSLSIFVGVIAGAGTPGELGLQVARMAAVVALVGVLALVAFPRFTEWSNRIRASEGLLAMVLAAVLFLAWLTEAVGGVAAITGAFMAGLGLGGSHLKDEIEAGLHRLAYAFFVPLFLVDIGLQADMRTLNRGSLLFALVLIVIAMVSKVLGSGLGALLGGFDWGEAFRMGTGMISRGEVGLIVAAVGVTEGILQPQLFSAVVLMVLATTIVTPPLLRWAFARKEAMNGATGDAGRS